MEITTPYFYIQKLARRTDFTIGFEFSVVSKTGPLQFCFDFRVGHYGYRFNIHEKISW